ncbi:MAG: DNA polymerase Y family protein [Verrucomicrobiales bacterium]|nr:DNA polymerase Y family protein [Verrucomicrobiales bacterium]
MFAAIHLPEFPLQAWLCREPGWRWEPVAVLSGQTGNGTDRRAQPRVIALNRPAREARIEPGMTAAQARARCAGVRLLPFDAEAEEAAQERLLALAARQSADFESTAPGLVTIDLGASPVVSHPDELRRLANEWVASLADAELDARVGWAPNPDLAALAARLGEPVRLFAGSAETIRAELAPLPLSCLEPAADHHGILTLLGIDTLGDLAALPRDEVAERLGPDGADLWDQARGRSHRLLTLVRPPADFSHSVDLDHEIASLEPLMFLVERSLTTLTARLSSAYLAASAIRLELRWNDGSAGEQVIRLTDPSRDARWLCQLVETRLEKVRFNRPVEGLTIELAPTRPTAQAGHLFEASLRDPNRFSETLSQLEALLGSDQVGSPEVLDTHRPDAFVMRPFNPHALTDSEPVPRPASGVADALDTATEATAPSLLPVTQGLPLRRFRPPLPVRVSTRRHPSTGLDCPGEIVSGEIRGRIHDCRGPWRASGDWWEPGRSWLREEWDIALDDDSLYRLSCHRDRQTNATGPAEWFVEGIYG